MSDEKLIDKRWEKAEEAMEKAIPSIQRLYRQIGEEAVRILEEIEFDYKKLNQKVPAKVRRYVNDKIEAWSDSGLLTGYLKYLVISHTWTYSSVLYLLLFGLYIEKYAKLKKIAERIFTITAKDTYQQSAEERGESNPKPLNRGDILNMSLTPLFSTSFFDYLDTLAIDQTDEMESFLMNYQMNGQVLTLALLMAFMLKQADRMLKVKIVKNKKRWSGVIEMTTRVVGNSAYIINTKEDQKVRFVAVIDGRTTKMCRSLNDQVFYVNKDNTFKRYSASAGGEITVTCKGLVLGLNMPPIKDHFHWCRSTLSYQVD